MGSTRPLHTWRHPRHPATRGSMTACAPCTNTSRSTDRLPMPRPTQQPAPRTAQRAVQQQEIKQQPSPSQLGGRQQARRAWREHLGRKQGFLCADADHARLQQGVGVGRASGDSRAAEQRHAPRRGSGHGAGPAFDRQPAAQSLGPSQALLAPGGWVGRATPQGPRQAARKARRFPPNAPSHTWPSHCHRWRALRTARASSSAAAAAPASAGAACCHRRCRRRRTAPPASAEAAKARHAPSGTR